MPPAPILPAVLVTGAAQRIGAAIARCYADAGWHVVVHYNNSEDAARELTKSLPSSQAVKCDLSNCEAACAMVDELASKLPDWRVLVNNASLFEEDTVTELNMATNRRAMQVNAATPVLMAQRYFAAARSRAGRRVIQLTDQKLANPNPDFFSYTMSKHAVDAAAVMLAMTCKADDRVYRLAPGAILPSHDQTVDEAETSHRMNLLHRRTRMAEMAEAALFLARAPLASGQQLFIDSGQHLLSQPRDVLYLAREEEGEN